MNDNDEFHIESATIPGEHLSSENSAEPFWINLVPDDHKKIGGFVRVSTL